MKTLKLLLTLLLAVVMCANAWADDGDGYATHYSASDNSTHDVSSGQRWPRKVTITSATCTTNNESGSLATARGHQLFFDCTASFKPVVQPGERVTATLDYQGGWMNTYLYIDKGRDGGFSYTVSTDGSHLPDPASDLVSWSRYTFNGGAGWDSEGTQRGGDYRVLPAFTAPSTSGKYRMRLKIDWDDINPYGTDGLQRNGGAYIDFTLVVQGHCSFTYVDESGATIANSAVALSATTGTVTHADVPTTATGLYFGAVGSQLYAYNVVSFRDKTTGNVYNTWDELTQNVTGTSASPSEIEVKLTMPAQAGRFYTIRHAGTHTNDNITIMDNHYLMVDATHENKLYVGDNEVDPLTATQYLFRLEDAGNGRFYIYNVGTNRYLHRPGKVGNNNPVTTSVSASAADNVYYISNIIVPTRPDIFVLGDATQLTPPLPASTTNNDTQRQYYLHNNYTGDLRAQVVRWQVSNAANNNSQWYVEEVNVHTATITFVDADGADVTTTMSGFRALYGASNAKIGTNTILTCTNDLALPSGYRPISWRINGGEEIATEIEFYAQLNALTADANVTIKVATGHNLRIVSNHRFAEGQFTWNGFQSASLFQVPIEPIDESVDDETVTLECFSCTPGYRFVNFTTADGQVFNPVVRSLSADVTITANFEIDFFTPADAAYEDYKWLRISSVRQANKFVASAGLNALPVTQDAITNGGYTQQWAFVGNSEGFKIVNRNTGLGYVLTIKNNAAPANDIETLMAPVEENSASQTWKLGTSHLTEAIEDSYHNNYCGYEILSTRSNSQGLNDHGGKWKFYQTPDAGDLWTIDVYEYEKENSALQQLSDYIESLQTVVDGDPGSFMPSEAYTTALVNARQTLETHCEVQAAAHKSALETAVNALSTVMMPQAGKWYQFINHQGNGNEYVLSHDAAHNKVQLLAYTDELEKDRSTHYLCVQAVDADGNPIANTFVFVSSERGDYMTPVTGDDGVSGFSAIYGANYNNFRVTSSHGQTGMPSNCFRLFASARSADNNSACTVTVTKLGGYSGYSTETFVYDDGNSSLFRIHEVEPLFEHWNAVTFRCPKTRDGHSYATFYGNYPVLKPEGVDVFYCDGVRPNGNLNMVGIEGDYIPSMQAVILRGDESLRGEEFTLAMMTEAPSVTTNQLEGTLQDVTVGSLASDGRAVFGLNGAFGEIGFYRGEDNVVIRAGRAFYRAALTEAPVQGSVRGFGFGFDDLATAISSIEAADATDVYDLEGRRVSELVPNRLYIRNGKKVIIK